MEHRRSKWFAVKIGVADIGEAYERGLTIEPHSRLGAGDMHRAVHTSPMFEYQSHVIGWLNDKPGTWLICTTEGVFAIGQMREIHHG